MKKKGLAITALTMSALMTFSTGAAVCDVSSAAESGAASASSAVEAAADEKPLKVALLLTGNLGDMSFLDSANEGMKEVEKKHNVTCQVIEMGSDSSKYEGNFLDASDEGYDIIIGSGWQSQEPIQNVAPDYPDTKYILFDASVDYDKGDYSNVYSINYKQNEGSFLAGVMAGEMTETNTIGFLGGMQGSVIDDFMLGYIQGAQYANKDIKVLTGYVNSYSDSATCKEMSLADYNQGNADVVFTAAGGRRFRCGYAGRGEGDRQVGDRRGFRSGDALQGLRSGEGKSHPGVRDEAGGQFSRQSLRSERGRQAAVGQVRDAGSCGRRCRPERERVL